MDLKDKINKLKLQAHISPLGVTCDSRLFFETLNEAEELENRISIETDTKQNMIKKNFTLQKENNKYKKVIKIIAEKVVDINYIVLVSDCDVEDYNRHVDEINKVSQIDYYKLTIKEFDLVYNTLKEMFRDV